MGSSRKYLLISQYIRFCFDDKVLPRENVVTKRMERIRQQSKYNNYITYVKNLSYYVNN